MSLNTKIKELEERKESAEAMLASTPDHPAPLLHPNMAELYHRKVADLTTLLEDPEAMEEAFEAIRSMIDEVHLIRDGNKLRIDLKVELASILNLCQGSKKPGQESRADAEQIKMVAGVGFEPTTFRL